METFCKQFVAPKLRKFGYHDLSPACPLDREKDMFLRQEQHKMVVRQQKNYNELHKCRFCGKVVISFGASGECCLRIECGLFV